MPKKHSKPPMELKRSFRTRAILSVRVLQSVTAPRHWKDLALRAGVPDAWDAMLALVDRVPAALDAAGSVLPTGFPPRVWTSIRAGMLAQSRRFVAALP